MKFLFSFLLPLLLLLPPCVTPCPRTADYLLEEDTRDCPASIPETFSLCVSSQCEAPNISSTIFTPKDSSFISLLNSTAQNLLYLKPWFSKPALIFTPHTESQVQAGVTCSIFHGIHFRVRSGGHDYEGSSYVSQIETPFIIIDLFHLREVTVNITDNTAWAQAGATNGEVYYKISQNSNTHAFPMGLCTSLGMGGHISGGAYGSLLRKHGLGIDHVLDVRMINSQGRVLNRSSMGEALFWAITGGGGGSFGVILAWKLRLISVPSIVTVFTVTKTLEQGASSILHKWQQVANTLDEDLFIRVIISPSTSSTPNKTKTLITAYNALFLGNKERLLELVGQEIPELEVKSNDCMEMNWIESVLYIAGFPAGTKPEVLLSGKPTFRNEFKAKSDFLRDTIPVDGLEGLWRIMLEEESPLVIMTPFGGKMDYVPEFVTPFPHRDGVICMIQYISSWIGGDKEMVERHVDWVSKVHGYMWEYMNRFPREAYVNYRDFDLGVNKEGLINWPEAWSWGGSYFKNNFWGLMKVKALTDPFNVFRHEQSIPTLFF